MIAELLEFLSAHAGMLLLGSTLLLIVGALAVAIARSPLVQQRLSQLSVACTLLWLALAVVPLPRLSWPVAGSGDQIDVNAASHQEAASSPREHDGVEAPSIPATFAGELLPGPEPIALATAPLDASTREAFALPAWTEVFAVAALCAGAVAAAWLVLGAASVAWIFVRSERAPERLLRMVRQLLDLDPQRLPRVRVSSLARGPFCLGIPGATIVLPEALATLGSEVQLRAVLAHEMAHLRRGDAWGQALFALAMPVLALHPLFWWLSHRARLSAELLADDAAATRLGASGYVRAFVDLAARRVSTRPLLVGVPALRSPSEFYRRMHMLLQRRDPLLSRLTRRHRLMQTAAAAVLLSGSIAFLGLRDLPAQDPPDPRAEIAALREERDKLRAEIAELRKLVEQLAPNRKGAADPATTPAEPPPTDAPREVRRQYVANKRADEWRLGDEWRPAEPAERDTVLAPRGRNRLELPADGARSGDNGYVLDLLTRSIDLEAEIQVLTHRLEQQEGLREKGLATAEDAVQTRAKLEACKKKRAVVASLLRAERQVTEQEMGVIAEQLRLNPDHADLRVRLMRAEARLQILRQ